MSIAYRLETPILQTAEHQLLLGGLGGLDLMGRNDELPFQIQCQAEGASWGNSNPILTIVRRLFGDGSDVDLEGDDNREVTFDVLLRALDSGKLAQAEVLLLSHLRRRNTLLWVPPDGVGAPTVFVIVWSSSQHKFKSDDEVRNTRRFTVSLQCQAFPRSYAETVTEALSVPEDVEDPLEATVDNGSSTTNWSAAGSPAGYALGVVSGSVRVAHGTPPNTPPPVRVLRRTATVDTSTMKYVTLSLKSTHNSQVYVALDNVQLAPLTDVLTGGPGTGYLRTITLHVDADSFTELLLVQSAQNNAGGGSLAVDQITQSNQPPILGTARQSVRTIEVGGTAPTTGSLEITHPDTGLGTVLVATYPHHPGYDPALRAKKISGISATDDDDLISGGYNSILTTPTVYEIPAAAVPTGTHLHLAALQASVTGTATITWSAQTFIDGDPIGPEVTQSARIALTAGEWAVGAPAELQLPPTAVPENSAATVRISLLGAVTSGTLVVDEAWSIWRRDEDNRPVGGFTHVECEGDLALFVDGPTDELPIPMLYRGRSTDHSVEFAASLAGDRADAWFPSGLWSSYEFHPFSPGTVGVFVVTSGALNASVALRHHERWIHHAAA